MNSPPKFSSLDGQESVGDLDNSSGADRKSADTADNMKRAATMLIQQYYYQLTKGCGNKDCSNGSCASSPSFHFSDIDCNKLAIMAVSLFKTKAPLCEGSPSKLSRVALEQEEEDSGPSTSESASTSGGQGAKSKLSSSSSVLAGNSSGSSSAGRQETHEFFTEEILNSLISQCEESNSWLKLIRAIGYVFSRPESIAASFRKESESAESAALEVTGATAASSSSSHSDAALDISSSGSSVDPEPPVLTVDLSSLRRSYQQLMSVPDQSFQTALINALVTVSQTLELQLRYPTSTHSDCYYLNIFIIILENPLLHSPEFLDSAFPNVCRAVSALSISQQAQLVRIWSNFSQKEMLSLVQALQQMITVRVINNESRWSQDFSVCDDVGVTSATCVLKILYYASVLAGDLDGPEILQREKERNDAESFAEHMQGALGMESKASTPPKEDPLAKHCGIRVADCRKPLIPFDDFINEPLNDSIDIELDYINHRPDGRNKFSFVPYNFILTTASKQTSMYFDNRIRMLQERQNALILQALAHGPPNPFLRVRVRRDHIIDDALVNLELIAMENPSDLRKQLFVEFEGEQGLDEGGVSKEFFQLIIEELFNPDIGMFVHNEETHHFWFNSQSFENDAQFTLIGIVLGLAIYNNCILDIHFPMVVYRKLLGKIGTFQDLKDVDPTLIKSLKDMLEYEGDDFVDVFDQTFRIGYSDVFGTSLTHDLKKDGDNITVTQENKQEFVDLYADYLLNVSIERQFRAFKRGFLMVTSESPLKMLFRPDELEMLVCGSKILDFQALESATEYDGGFIQDSPTIRNFWLVVHEMSDIDKRKLLQFTTGTDRVPVGGLSKLKMIIARNGPDSERLPTSHTCFNVLLLPDYPTVEKMRDRLTKAINYSKGFGML